MVVGVAGGADAGGSVEGVDFEAGVVGDDDLVGGVEGVVDGFEAGVAFEGGFVSSGGAGGSVYRTGKWARVIRVRCLLRRSRESLPGLEVAVKETAFVVGRLL